MTCRRKTARVVLRGPLAALLLLPFATEAWPQSRAARHEAWQAYIEAIRARPGFGEAHNNVAAVVLRTGNLEEAREHLRLAEKAGFTVSSQLKAEIEGGAPIPGASAAPAPTDPALPPVIRHEPLRCVVADTFPAIAAEVAVSAAPARVRVRFRRSDSLYWYMVKMRAEGERFVALLPKPKPGLGSFRYAIEAVDDVAASSQTDEATVTVADDPSACPTAPVAGRTATVFVVEVPAGAPARPPVPEGFSASSVTGEGGTAVGVFYMPPRVAAAVGVAAIGGLAVAFDKALAHETILNPDLAPPELVLLGGDPPAGSTLSASRDRLRLSFRVTLRRTIGSGQLRTSLYRRGSLGSCHVLEGFHGPILAETPVELTVEGALTPTSSFCPRRTFDIDRGILEIQEITDQVLSTTRIPFPVAYTLTP